MKELLILGGGTAGTMVANRLHQRLDRHSWRVTVVDQDHRHAYQPGYLFVPFGDDDPADLVRPRAAQLTAGVRFVTGGIQRVRTEEHTVDLDWALSLPYDQLVIATGTSPRPEEVPGMAGRLWRESIFDFYTLEGATALRAALADFTGGRLVVHVTDMPIKCPVAPLEFVFLVEAHLRQRGIRDQVELVYVTPLPGAFTTPVADAALTQVCLDEEDELQGSDRALDRHVSDVDDETAAREPCQGVAQGGRALEGVEVEDAGPPEPARHAGHLVGARRGPGRDHQLVVGEHEAPVEVDLSIGGPYLLHRPVDEPHRGVELRDTRTDQVVRVIAAEGNEQEAGLVHVPVVLVDDRHPPLALVEASVEPVGDHRAGGATAEDEQLLHDGITATGTVAWCSTPRATEPSVKPKVPGSRRPRTSSWACSERSSRRSAGCASSSTRLASTSGKSRRTSSKPVRTSSPRRRSHSWRPCITSAWGSQAIERGRCVEWTTTTGTRSRSACSKAQRSERSISWSGSAPTTIGASVRLSGSQPSGTTTTGTRDLPATPVEVEPSIIRPKVPRPRLPTTSAGWPVDRSSRVVTARAAAPASQASLRSAWDRRPDSRTASATASAPARSPA